MDLGANQGLYAFGMGDKVGPKGKVLAVDADRFAMAKLQEATQLVGMPQIAVLHGALSNHDGEVLFYVRDDHSVTGTQSLRPNPGEEHLHTPVPTPSYTIDTLSRRLGREEELAAIKIDVEGAEAMAFQAAAPSLFNGDGPFWLVEIHPGALSRFDVTPADVTKHFPSDRFDVFLKPKHPLPHADGDTSLRRLVASERYNDSLYYNMLAIPRGERWSERRRSIAHFIPGLDG
jgi:FkbM family methyltransferase